jgi:dTMP kinase
VSGFFATFEGPEGAGKSTQIRLLAAALEAEGYSVVCTREPGGTAIGEQIRTLLLGDGSGAMCPETEAYLHTAARAQHVHEVIRPVLTNGLVVLCDRFVDSTFAYQGGGRRLPMALLTAMQQLAVAGITPDIRILLDLPVEIGLRRRHAELQTANRMDNEELEFHRRVRNTYLELAEENPNYWRVIDASVPVDTVHEKIRSIVVPIISVSDA